MHQLALPYRSGCLLGGGVLRTLCQVQLSYTHAYGTGGNHQQFLSGVVQVGQNAYQIGHAADVQFAGFMCQGRGTQFQYNSFFLGNINHIRMKSFLVQRSSRTADF